MRSESECTFDHTVSPLSEMRDTCSHTCFWLAIEYFTLSVFLSTMSMVGAGVVLMVDVKKSEVVTSPRMA